ncbi:MAG TPA: Hsp20/alpha crystallin family protein [Blastocatellia bacterium]|nr:Hsp20/alpha crystallin family protein [Blastocatellia bacterium]
MASSTGLAPRKIKEVALLDPFRLFRERMTDLFDESLFAPFVREPFSLKAWTPSCDVYETNNEIVVKAELPGVKKENVHIAVENGMLIITGERKLEEEIKKENYQRIELNYGEFSRSFVLPTGVEIPKIAAAFTDGLLTVTLPKLEEAKRKAIEVKVK